MDGEISVASIVGKGSTFRFTARFQKAGTTEDVVPVFADLDNLKVLVVDDSATNRFLVTEYLKIWGCRYAQAADTKTALKTLLTAAAQNDPFQAAILDLAMPEMDGYEATRNIRKKDPGVIDPEVPVIAMTANAMQGDREKCLDAGMNDFLAKPIKPKDLAQKIDEWLSPEKNAGDDRKFFTNLLQDLSSNVTEMFRDPSFYKVLRESLCQNGFLCLGSKETVGLSRHSDTFEDVVKDEKIYRKIGCLR